MLKKGISQHKRVAMGGAQCDYRGGGRVVKSDNVVGAGTGTVSGTVKNPLIAARRNNGVKGM